MDLHKLPFEINSTLVDGAPADNDLVDSTPIDITPVDNLPVEQNEPVAEIIDEYHVDNDVGHIPEELISALQVELETFSKENAILKNILISTADGFEVASLLMPGYELHVRKVSALTSSLLGISSAMLQEVGEGEQNAVFMESDDSMILFNRVPAAQKMLCLMAVTSKDESIGQIFWRVRKLSDSVIEICNKYF
ncbi:roadblock/LC7 domain-containing protein [Kluyvera ascorbata]|uniref:roadblock/LC7 domain-containing protein n=1 Tax=Kluyvera ascorbata TaxID=51288 RepID=UPI00294152C5|nr:roadblock/LC7 domain-containing protein [Kluyvera ascorbata]